MKISLWTRFLDIVAPRTCVSCGCRLAVTEEVLCSVCNSHLPRTNFHENPYDNPLVRLFWGQLPIERATAFFFYTPHSATSRIIYSLKYHDWPEIGVVMGRQVANEIVATGFFDGIDGLLAVPLARKRRRQRGYNQSEMIVKGINEVTGIQVMRKIVSRSSFMRSQTQLGYWERRENVAGAFVLKEKKDNLEGKHLLLVDDVVTTGATIMACAEELKSIKGIKLSVLSLGLTKA